MTKSRTRWAENAAQIREKYIGNVKERSQMENLGVDGTIYCILEKGREGVDWIILAQDRNLWRTIVYVVMNLRVS
jgi:hypothetical protein